MHFYPFNIGDYATATAHLEPLEDIAYRRLMDLYYSTEKPIPECLNKTARLIRMRTHSECIAIVLDEFFTLEDDGYHCDRIDVELFKFHEKSEKASKSAKARWKKAKKNQKVKASSERNANALKTHSEGNAKQEPINKKQEPINNTSASRFDEFYDLYDKKVGGKKVKAKFDKLSEESIDKIFEVVSDYVASTPDKQYRKAPLVWLNGEHWNDEIQKPLDLKSYDYVVDLFNEAMKHHEQVPQACMMDKERVENLEYLFTNTSLEPESMVNYFEQCSTGLGFTWFRERNQFDLTWYLSTQAYKIAKEKQ